LTARRVGRGRRCRTARSAVGWETREGASAERAPVSGRAADATRSRTSARAGSADADDAVATDADDAVTADTDGPANADDAIAACGRSSRSADEPTGSRGNSIVTALRAASEHEPNARGNRRASRQ
jgi:hypothetical protein